MQLNASTVPARPKGGLNRIHDEKRNKHEAKNHPHPAGAGPHRRAGPRRVRGTPAQPLLVHWVCNRRDDSKDLCPIPQIPEATLTAAVLRLHNKLLLHGVGILQPLLEQLREVRERELRSNSRLSDIDKEIAHISGQNLALSRLKSKGCIDSALALSQADGLSRKLRDLRRLRRKLLETAGGDEQIRATEAMLDYLEAARWQDEADPEWFGSLVDRITVASAEEVTFQLPNGLELAERLV